jgi:hypothetical protein
MIPMSAHIFELISTHDGREAILDARFQGGWQVQRPEIIIPLPAQPGTDQLRLQDAPLRIGDRVRAVRSPHIGISGTVMEMPEAAARIATGARLPVARVKPEEQGEPPILIPIVNLETIR